MFLFPLRCCRSRLTVHNGYAFTRRANFSIVDNENESNISKFQKSNRLGQTVILVQQGSEIQELPTIVRRLSEHEVVALCSNEKTIKNIARNSGNGTFSFDTGNSFGHTNDQNTNTNDTRVAINPITDPDNTVKHLEKARSAEKVLRIIDAIPENELTQEILVSAMDKIIRVEVNESLIELEKSSDLYQKVIVQICKKCDTKALFDMLDQFRMFLYMNVTIDQLCDELLLRSSDGCLNVIEICESINKFIECRRFNSAEKFWSGLSDLETEINAENIKFVFQILPKLKVSRRMVVGILERKILDVFPLLTTDAACDILDALKQCPNNCSYRMMKPISRWLNTDLHVVNETQLEHIIHCFSVIQYSDQDIENALERYIKAKATKIKAQTLIVEILKHVSYFRIFNNYILDGCSEYLIINSDKIDPGYIRDILYPYGLFAFQPTNSTRFWQVVEKYLDLNFDKIAPAQIVEIMFTPIYLEIFPVNFIKRIFNPYFINLLHTNLAFAQLHTARNNLILLDTALALGCNEYNGPMLPRAHSDNPIMHDNRIKRTINEHIRLFTSIAGGGNRFTTNTIPRQLPYNSLYVIDILLHPAGMTRLWRLNLRNDRNVYVAILIHLPDHYDSTGTYLTGQQKMRIKHLRIIGLKVVSLSYERLAKLAMHPRELHQHVTDCMKKALPAIDIEKT